MNPAVDLLHFPPDYFTAERFLFWVERVLRGHRVAGRPISRVLFNSLSQLQYNSPMFQTEPLFIAALIELFRSERVSSLFLHSAHGGDVEIQDIFDTILFASRERDTVLLEVGHAPPSPVGPRRWRVDRQMNAGGQHELILSPDAVGLT